MAKIHIRTGDHHGNYEAVIHFAVPTGNNAAGVAWSAAIVSDGENVSVLTTLDTTQLELDAITAGTRYEFVQMVRRFESGGGSDLSISGIVDQYIDDKRRELQRKYKYYGKTIS